MLVRADDAALTAPEDERELLARPSARCGASSSRSRSWGLLGAALLGSKSTSASAEATTRRLVSDGDTALPVRVRVGRVDDSHGARRPARIDLHCHSRYSGATDLWMARTLRVGEYTGDPADIYRRAKAQGMTHVTLTDRDTIDGGLRLAHHEDFVLGAEVTAFFPVRGARRAGARVGPGRGASRGDPGAALQRATSSSPTCAPTGSRHGLAQPTSLRSSGLRPDQFEQLLLLFGLWEVRDGATHKAANDLALSASRRPGRRRSRRLAEKHGIAPAPPSDRPVRGLQRPERPRRRRHLHGGRPRRGRRSARRPAPRRHAPARRDRAARRRRRAR